VTARFNRNILQRVNDLVGASFDPDAFRHHAFYDETLRRIEMHLISAHDQTVHISGHDIDFAAGERIHTESSYKYTIDGFSDLAARAGLRRVQSWMDDECLFALHYLEPMDR
jgi:uncharacterized SAM-dependent methyltransferase